MTKMDEKKKAIGHTREFPSCQKCKRFTSTVERMKRAYSGTTFTVERDLRCSLHKFAIKKTAYCNDFERKEVSE